MSGKNFDVFISYRRSDGTVKAKALDLAFGIDDCRTFLDFKSLGTGAFDKRLENAVLDAPIFIMVLTPDYFARCNEKGDWVRREIELALDNGKIIIPINYDAVLNGVPDYLDEEFRNRVGCHNFVNLHGDNTFDATIKDIFDNHIRPYVSTHSNNDGKAKVSVKTDADCELILDDEIIATVQKDKTKQVFVERGEHFFTARSTEFPQIEEEIEKNIDDLSFKYSLRIKLADKLQPLREEIRKKGEEELRLREEEERKCKAEAERLEREKQETERKRREEKARLEKERLEAERRKEEAERLKRERQEAERRRKEWESMSPIEQAVKRFVQNPTSNPQTLTGHSYSVWSVAASPDGKYLASGSVKIIKGKYFWNDDTYGEEIIIWDAKSGQILKTLEGHSGGVSSVCWSSDGKYLANGSGDGIIIIWNANSGESLKTLEGHSTYVSSVCWSPDGKYLASGSDDKTLIIWDAKSGQRLRTLKGHSDYVNSVCWSPDGKYLASGSEDNTVIIWDAMSGQRLKTLKGHSKSVNSVSWSPDGKYLASGSRDATVIIWDAKSGQKLKSLEGHSNTVSSVCWSPDGKYLASGSLDTTVVIWDAESGQRLKTLKGHSAFVLSVSWSPDGKYLASGSEDYTVKIWGVE